MNKIILLALCCLIQIQTQAQQHSWVFFESDEAITLDAHAEDLKKQGIEVIGTSKWLNAACVKGYPKSLSILNSIQKVVPLGRYNITQNSIQQAQEDFKYGSSDWQLKMIGLDEFHKKGFTGKNVTIALFDAGFYRVDSLAAFDTLRKRNQIVAEWDFHYRDTNVYIQDGHGMYVLSIAGGYWPDSIMGAAPDANFLLARTEIANREIHLEEYAWVKALEWADSIGVDIIHSSLGYSVFDTLEGDYTYKDMDGKTTIITQATDIAATKGIFITNSAGNEGTKPWHYITAPCDGKYVLCVGAVDSNRVHADFSSYGPSADGRIKPDVVAMGKGVTYVNKEGQIRTGGGTSFSGPIVAGMVACLKQAWPLATNEHLFRAIIQSADKYNNPDTAYGYGLPNVQKADSIMAIFAGMDKLSTTKIKVYPNPVTSFLQIESLESMQQVVVLDATGRQIQIPIQVDKQDATIDVRNAKAGTYFLVVRLMNGEIVHHKISKLHE